MWMGASTDTKPTGARGDRLVETDTYKRYIYTGATWLLESGFDANGGLLVSFASAPANFVNPNSATAGFDRAFVDCNVTCCDGTSAVPIGGGATNDTVVLGAFIEKNAGPGVLTIAGFGKTTDGASYTAKTMTIQGSTTLDVLWAPPGGLKNNVAACTATCTVDEIAWIFWRPIA